MVYSSAFVLCGLGLMAVFSTDPAAAHPFNSSAPQPSKPWHIEHWVSLAPTEHRGGEAPGPLARTLDPWAPVPEEIIVTEPRHVEDLAPLIARIDATNPRSLDAAQPVVRNLQTFCEDKGPPSTICFDMTQVPLRTQLLRLRSILFGP